MNLLHSSCRGARPLLALLALLLLWPTGPAGAQGGSVDLAAYEQLLREGQAAAARGDRISLDDVARRLTTIGSVRLADGTGAPVAHDWLTLELERQFPRLDLIAARLGALVEALSAPPSSAPADAAARLDAILAGPPFAELEAQRPDWLTRFFQWLDDLLGELAAPVGDAAAGTPGAIASWAVTGLAVALVLAVLVIWLRGLRRTLRPVATLAPAAAEAHDEADARSQAAALAGAGNYREAVRLLALSALLWLDESGRLRYDAHQTNREHLARLREQPELRRRLRPVVDIADRVWYGNTPLDSSGYAAYERQVEVLRERQADAP